ncbi:MAG TPA: O-antigen ligase family protein [Candidatus Eisenbacteria bacterium]|nr:O-antigen ligase family protein [Candidatus Eisenbacteria bacterium]
MPWGVFAFRFAGLAALIAVAAMQLRGSLEVSTWSARAALLAIGVVLLAGASALVSVHYGKSLEAMLNLLAILGLFLATLFLVRGSGAVRFLAFAQILCALPVAILGILQHYRPELVPAGSSYPGRALGPFGQPNRLGGYLIAVLPLALTLSFITQDRMARGLLLGSVVILSLGLILSFSRGAWIAFAIAAVALAVVLVRWPALSPRPAQLAVTLGALLVPALLLLPSVLSRVATKPQAEKAWNLPFDPEREGSAAMRGAVWQGALSAAESRPLLGWGVGAFREAFDRSKSATMKRLEAEGGRTSDQAHGYYLATLVERGVPGLAVFVLFAVAALAAGAAVIASGAPAEARLLAAGLVASALALLAHAVLEDNLALAPHALLLHANLGLLVLSAPGARKRANRSRAFGAAGAAVALVALVVGLQSARAEAAAIEATRDGAAGAVRAAQAGYVKAARLAPWTDSYAIGEAKASEALGEYVRAEGAFERAVSINPSDPVTKHEFARLYLAHEERFEAGARARATTLLEAALAQNPYYAEIRNDLGVARLRAGDREGAKRAFQEAAEGRSAFVDPLVNLAALAQEEGDRTAAATWTRQALERNPNSARALAMASELGMDRPGASGTP